MNNLKQTGSIFILILRQGINFSLFFKHFSGFISIFDKNAKKKQKIFESKFLYFQKLKVPFSGEKNLNVSIVTALRRLISY